jgi:hypothetical protein
MNYCLLIFILFVIEEIYISYTFSVKFLVPNMPATVCIVPHFPLYLILTFGISGHLSALSREQRMQSLKHHDFASSHPCLGSLSEWAILYCAALRFPCTEDIRHNLNLVQLSRYLHPFILQSYTVVLFFRKVTHTQSFEHGTFFIP